jgi:hypothetical protein
MMSSRWLLGSVVLLGACWGSYAAWADDPPKDAPKDAPKDPPKETKPSAPPLSPKELEEAVYKAIMASAGIIDTCTEAYTNEYPNNTGTANMATTVVKDGSVAKVTVNTSLEGSRNLVPCLEKAGKTWKFPKLGDRADGTQLNLTVNVKKGTKFTMRKPGEKAEEKKPEQAPEGFLQFLPQAWGQ